jgi:hypothetical protein
MCHVQLVTDGTSTDDPSVFGQEAHIVAQSTGGPRAGEVADVDGYGNLILLCSKCHKRIDDQVGHFTVQRLRVIKNKHEEWIRALGEPTDDPFRFSVDGVPNLADTNEQAVRGTGSKVLHVDLARGGYRVTWRAEGGYGNLVATHQSARKGRSLSPVIAFLEPTRDRSLPVQGGERLLRVDDSGRHLFSVTAPAATTWEIIFTRI